MTLNSFLVTLKFMYNPFRCIMLTHLDSFISLHLFRYHINEPILIETLRSFISSLNF